LLGKWTHTEVKQNFDQVSTFKKTTHTCTAIVLKGLGSFTVGTQMQAYSTLRIPVNLLLSD